MDGKGRLKRAERDWESGKFEVTFEMDFDVSRQIDEIKEKDLRINAKQWREKKKS